MMQKYLHYNIKYFFRNLMNLILHLVCFFLKNLLRSQKNRSLKLSKQQIGCLQMFLHNGFTKHVAFKIWQFLLNHRYATALILRRRKLQIQRKKTEKYLDFFVSDLNTLYPTRDIDTYGFRSTLQIRIINQLFLGKAGLSMF